MNGQHELDSHEAIDQAFATRLRAQLVEAADTLDAVTAARLSAARHRALAAAASLSAPRWLPWSGVIAASLLLALVLVRVAQQPVIPAPAIQVTASAPAAGASPPAAALIDSDVAVIADLEFYDWLEEQDALL